MSNPDARRLLSLLEQERKALRKTDLARLERLRPRKEALLTRVEQARLTRKDTEALRESAGRNARLFEALIAGIREARSLIQRARDPARGSTYGRDGLRAALDPPGGTLIRRA